MATSGSIERQLGIVIGKLGGIEDRLHRQDESRAALHRRVDDLVLRQTHAESDVAFLRSKVEAQEKVTSEVTTLRTKAEGAGTVGMWLLKLRGWILSAAGGFAATWMLLKVRSPP